MTILCLGHTVVVYALILSYAGVIPRINAGIFLFVPFVLNHHTNDSICYKDIATLVYALVDMSVRLCLLCLTRYKSKFSEIYGKHTAKNKPNLNGTGLLSRAAAREPDMAMTKLLPQHAASTENIIYGLQHS